MEAPQIKKATVIIPAPGHTIEGYFEVFTTDSIAAAWVEKEAPKFGKVEQRNHDTYGWMLIFILPNYDRDEVIAYLERRDPPTLFEDHIPLRVPQVGDKVRVITDDGDDDFTGYITHDEEHIYRISDTPIGKMTGIYRKGKDTIQVIERKSPTPSDGELHRLEIIRKMKILTAKYPSLANAVNWGILTVDEAWEKRCYEEMLKLLETIADEKNWDITRDMDGRREYLNWTGDHDPVDRAREILGVGEYAALKEVIAEETVTPNKE